MSLRLFTYLFLLSFPYLTIFESVQLYSCYSNGSDPEFCHPLEISLSFGSSIIATSTCGLVNESMYATRTSPSEVNCCLMCNETAHPPSFLTDFMVYPPTWWQSENAIYTPRTVNLTLSVGKLAEVTLISLTFASYKPESLYIERSIDFGVSYEPYHYFSSQCTAKYGIDSDATILVDGQVTCEDISSTSRPGILIFFPSRDRPTDVNTTFQDSDELASFTVATNLRVVLDGHRIDPNQIPGTLKGDMAYYYAISEFSVNGRCICNGHASMCDTYIFACQCEHNTTGVNCEECEEFHFDLPWRRATPSEPFACRRCECNNHSFSCNFSLSAYLSSGNTTGGVCINCTDNTVGQYCDMCALGYYMDSSKQLSDRDLCRACECNSAGENNSGNCNQTTGQCYCKYKVVGRNCNECSYGYYNLSAANPEGCTMCGCDTFGSLKSSQCDAISGQCMCRNNTQGLTCNECKPGFYNILSGTYDGCVECGCNVGSSSSNCNETGHCQCRGGVAGRICDQVMDGYFIPQADYMTYEAESGSGNFTLISKSSGINVEFTGAGYARLTSGSILTLSQFLRVPVSGTYNFTIRYTLTTSNAPISLNIVLHPESYTQSSPQNAQSCSQEVISLTSFPLENIETGVSMIAEYNGVCLNSQISYKIYLEPTSANVTSAFVDIDSFVVIAASPLSALDVFTSNTASISSYIQNCVELRKSILNWASVNFSFCDPITLSAAAELYTSLLPCQCNLNGSTNKSCGINGQCYCYMGVGSDKNCSICLPGYHSLVPGVGCSKCNCSTEGSTSDVCNVSNGSCFCLANVAGFNCDYCATKAYNFTPGVGCVSCDCDVMGSSDLQCTTDGVCQCKPGVTGVKCEICKIGYFGMNDSGCSICDCDSRGVKIILTCDRMTGNCKCKANVEGRRCDQCTSGHINLQLANPNGCQPCYCSSRGDMCSEARGFIQGEQRTNFTDGDVFVNEGWRTLDSVQADGAYSVYSQPYSPMGTGIAIGVNYIQAPAKFLGNKLSSYSQILIMRFSLDPTPTQLPELTCPPYNILLSGGGMTIGICNSSLLSHIPVNNDIITIRILFHESYKWRRHDNNDYVTTQEFQYILSDLDSLLLRASFTSSNTIIHEVILPVALRSSQGPPVNWVENCSCNANYSGLSCQNCAGGYFRQNNDTCHVCQCFGDNVRCDPITGVCTSCPPYSTGQFCEKCLDGFYGDPELDINCIPCSCPGVGGTRSFSDTCDLISSTFLTPNMSNMECTDCRVGHGGIRCELCDDNYFGDPGGIFGVVKGCTLCDCNGNINLNASGNCHNTTGECLKCLYNTTGVKCEQCEDGFFGDAIFAKNCSPCGCDLQGSSDASTCNLVSGQCNCRNNVLGRRCDYCPMGYFGISNGTGCTECACNTNGSVTINSCHNVTGKCQCKVGVTNDKCDQCYEGYYNFTSTGCTPCNCFKGGSIGINCSETGQCICKEGVFSDKCDTCAENFYDVTSGCSPCPACYVELKDKVNELRRNISVVNTTLTAYESSVPPSRFIDRLNQAINKVVELHTTLSILQNKKEQLLMLITELNQTAMYLTEFIREDKELDQLEGQVTQITANADGILILINETESDILMLHTFIENILRPNETQVLNYNNQLNEILIQLRADVIELNNIAALHRRQVDTIESAVSNSSNLSSLASQSVTAANQFVTKVLSRKINRLLREVTSLKYYTLLLKYEAIEILLKAKSKLAESKDLLRDAKLKNSNSNTSLSYQNRTLIQLESDISSLVYANQQLNKTFILLNSEVSEFASNLSAIYSNITILQSNNTELYTTANCSYRYASGLVNKSNETIQSLENRLAILTDFDNRTQNVASKASASLIKVEEIRENSTRVLNNSIKILSNFSATLEKSVAALNLTIQAGSIASDTTLNLTQSNTLLTKYLNDTKSNITRFNQSLTHINNLVSLAYNIQNNQFTMLEQTANKTLNDSLQKAQDFEFYSNLSLAKANMILKNIYNIIASLPRSAVNISEAREQANALRDALEKAKIQDVYDSLLMRYSQQMKQKQDFADKIKKLKKEFASLKDFEKSLPKTCSPVRSLD